MLSQTKPTVHIGKNGVTEAVLSEIERQLKDKGYVKVKIEKSVIRILERDRKEVAEEVARRLGAELIDVRGRTFVLIDTRRGISIDVLTMKAGRGRRR
jgi:RNA-binding protein